MYFLPDQNQLSLIIMGWKKKYCLKLTWVNIFFCKNHQPKISRDNQGNGYAMKMTVFWDVAPCSVVEVY
jgi:hypothetical protein